MKSVLRTFVSLVLLGTMSYTTADDTDELAPHKGQFYIAPGVAYIHGPDHSRYGYEEADVGPGVVLGYSFSERWSFEILGANVKSDFENVWGRGSDDIEVRWADFLYSLDEVDGWQPFFVMGAGTTKYQFDGIRSDSRHTQANVGFGVFRELSENIALRADIRAISSPRDGGINPAGFVGLTGFIGAAPEPEPPADSDGDGVPNDQDQCPTTPPGRTVDANGCQLDGDGDGVVDGDDRCPETPAGAKVDSRGCALDSDGDGVPDYRDDCPDTSAGALVNERGCYIELEESVTIDMNLEFDVDKAEILPKHGSEIGRVVKFLRQYPTANAVIEGHTDSSGSQGYNQKLSERRAKSVHDHLVANAGVSADRLSWAGFGEDRPIADNETTAGKQRNRRVSAVVSGTHTVRQTKED
ncbi:MAG: OmpA family protein [Pseudomonadales bacterium]|nr:OmpA family protein [Pseudomonadales bacterium]